MQYFVLEAATTEGGTAKAVTEKETEREALMLLHQVMASAMANESVTEALCIVVNNYGGIVKNEHYIVESEEETEG